MFKNYFKTAIKSIIRNKRVTIINLIGLVVALSSCYLIYIYINFETSFDKMHDKGDRIYRIYQKFKRGKGYISTATSPYFVCQEYKDYCPDVENFVRITWDFIRSGKVKYRDNEFMEDKITCVDPSFFNVFSFPLIQGNPNSVLKNPYTVVISDEKARRYFKNESPIGKTLRFIDPYDDIFIDLEVTGIYEKMPANSHFHKDFLISMATAETISPNMMTSRGWTSQYSYVLFKKGTNIKSAQKQLDQIINEHESKEFNDINSFNLQALSNIHLKSNLKDEIEANGNIIYVYIFGIVVLLILFIASINYINMSLASIAERSKEIGIRKTTGAFKYQIILQILFEIIIIFSIAIFLSLILVKLLGPYFSKLTLIPLNDFNVYFSQLFLIFIIVSVIIGIITGIVPAIKISTSVPTFMLSRIKIQRGKMNLSSKYQLLLFQFVISTFLIICTLVIFKQWQYLKNKNLGLDTKQIIEIPIQNQKTLNNYPLIKRKLLEHVSIIGVTGTHKALTRRFTNYSDFSYENENFIVPYLAVDFDFFETFDIKILTGRSFIKEKDNNLDAIIINETANKLLNIEHDLNKNIRFENQNSPLIGIAEDINFESLHYNVSPMVFFITRNQINNIYVKLEGKNINREINMVKDVFNEVTGDNVFQYHFLSNQIEKAYKLEKKLFSIFTLFTVLAIIISSLGVFGLSLLISQSRIKEIGIRKTIGSSTWELMLLFLNNFIIHVILALIIATPIGYLILDKWLQNFAYKTNINWWVFIIAGALTMTIAFLTVSWQSWMAARRNPVEALRYE